MLRCPIFDPTTASSNYLWGPSAMMLSASPPASVLHAAPPASALRAVPSPHSSVHHFFEQRTSRGKSFRRRSVDVGGQVVRKQSCLIPSLFFLVVRPSGCQNPLHPHLSNPEPLTSVDLLGFRLGPQERFGLGWDRRIHSAQTRHRPTRLPPGEQYPPCSAPWLLCGD